MSGYCYKQDAVYCANGTGISQDGHGLLVLAMHGHAVILKGKGIDVKGQVYILRNPKSLKGYDSESVLIPGKFILRRQIFQRQGQRLRGTDATVRQRPPTIPLTISFRRSMLGVCQ